MPSDLLLYVGPDRTNEELRYALRTWEKYLTFRKLYVVGGPIPGWFTPDIFQPNPIKHTKMKQCFSNLAIGLADKRLTEDIILMMDDIFLLQPVGDWETNYNRGTLEFQASQGKPSDPYTQMLVTTQRELEKTIPHPLSFEEHLPFRCNRKKLLEILEEYGMEKMGTLLYRSIYGNRYNIRTQFRPDVKLKDVRSLVPDGVLAYSTNRMSFRGNGGSYAKYHFLTPSRFERN